MLTAGLTSFLRSSPFSQRQGDKVRTRAFSFTEKPRELQRSFPFSPVCLNMVIGRIRLKVALRNAASGWVVRRPARARGGLCLRTEHGIDARVPCPSLLLNASVNLFGFIYFLTFYFYFSSTNFRARPYRLAIGLASPYQVTSPRCYGIRLRDRAQWKSIVSNISYPEPLIRLRRELKVRKLLIKYTSIIDIFC